MVMAAAVVVGAVVASRSASRASKRAARAQSEAADAGIAEQRRQYDLTRGDMSPWMQAGGLALERQQSLLGLLGVEQQQEAFDAFKESPGQQFLRERGQRALTRNASAIGGLGGGNVRSALVQQGIGFAQQDYGNYYNRLAGISNTGQQTSAQLGQLGAQSATNISSLLGVAGQARASGILGAAQARATMYSSIIGAFGMARGGGK